jgi:hypothetical protein
VREVWIGCHFSGCDRGKKVGILSLSYSSGATYLMVLVYESDPLDDEHARGRFYHVCRGRIDRTPLEVPSEDRPHECQQCGIDLEAEDFFMALQKGSV